MIDLQGPVDWSFPVPIHFGPGRLAELGSLCRQAGMHRPLVVTDQGSCRLPFVASALESLAASDLPGAVFSGISPNPTDADVAKGRAVFRHGEHDGVVAIGGGSGMDGGKAISLVACNERDLWQFDYDVEVAELDSAKQLVPLICIPTTAGTGAETESTAMVTDTVSGTKRCVWHPRQKPAAAILDPELTIGLPANLTAWTGCDALVHAIEAFSVPAWHPQCDGIALEAMRLINRWLPGAVDDGSNLEARGGMLAGSCLAGVSFLKGLGLVHAISHMVGAVHDTHHGLTNAVLLPAVLRYNRTGLDDKIAFMCQAMSLPGEHFDDLYGAVVKLLDDFEIPVGLSDIGVSTDTVAEIAAKAYTDPARATNPVEANVADIENLIEEVMVRGR